MVSIANEPHDILPPFADGDTRCNMERRAGFPIEIEVTPKSILVIILFQRNDASIA
jgi:hypothetical protein